MKNETVRVLGVDYTHLNLADEGDLYVTEYGLPFIENLKPENFWSDRDWFKKNSEALSGTSSVYRVRTKEVEGKSSDIVVKWNRMGQDIPGADENAALANAEFNTPFEEFSLVMELRDASLKSAKKIITQKPLAIYEPLKHVELSRTGRKEYRMHAKIQQHKEISLNMFRLYAVIYEWVEGIDAVQAFEGKVLDWNQAESLALRAQDELKEKGFAVRDNKPHHVIVKPKEGVGLTLDKEGRDLYALIDFELLERMPEREERTKRIKRASYLERQRDRFLPRDPKDFPSHLKPTNVLGVPYVYGRAESTGGDLWVVGNDPSLFDYFLPERWKTTPRTKLSMINEIYHTLTKDNINLVWRVSNLGMQPDVDPFKEDEKKILEHGYNSPFEEFHLAIDLSEKGILTTYPRAIYMTGSKTQVSTGLFDNSRHESHSSHVTPDGTTVLRKDRDYVIIWGYWNGPDEKLAVEDGDYYEAIDALRAYREKIITQEEYIALMDSVRNRLSELEIEDLNLRGNHLLLSLDAKSALVLNDQGDPEVRICSFELLKTK